MSLRWFGALAVVALMGCVPGLTPAPAPSASAKPIVSDGKDYDPIAEGAEWVFQGTSGTEAVEVTTRYSNVSTSSAAVTADTETVSKVLATGKTSTFTGKAKRMADRTITTDNATGAQTTMMIPLTVGRSWNSGTSRFKVEGVEAVTVPAGTYAEALKVTKKQGDSVVTLWMVDQVGTVKLTAPAEAGGTLTLELKSFKIP